jgi:hypothetical protein
MFIAELFESSNDYLWHGSREQHDVLYPRQAVDTGGAEGSNKNAVYATPNAKVAIAMGLTTPGSDTAMFPNDPQMVLFKGEIRHGQMVYLHKVPKDLFIRHTGQEYYSKPGVKEVKPIEVVPVSVDKFLNLIRTATPKDLELQKKYMAEVFDQPYKATWEKSDYGDYDALARLPDGTPLSIMFNHEGNGEYQVEFYRNNSQEVTGEGDAHRIFATVLSAIQRFIKRHHPARIRFSATKDDDDNNQSRTKLYDRLVQRYAAAWGYSVDVSEYAGSTVYELFNDLNEMLQAAESGVWTVTESGQTVEIRKSSLFDQSLASKSQQFPNLPNKIKEFLNAKSANPGQPYPNDTPFTARGPIARALPKLRHLHLTRDLSLFYSIEGRGPTVIKLYGVFSHAESGTGTPGNINRQKNLAQQLSNQPIAEITAVPTVAKSKRQHLDVMPNDGRPIPPGREEEFLTDFISKMPGGYELWSWTDRGTKTYYVYDPETRICQLATAGRPYSENRDSFVVQGTYSGPRNRFRAADLYAFLILELGITLVSDNKQSEGGYRVWQELERRYGRRLNLHGFDTKTNEPVNVTTKDEPDTHVARADVKKAGPQMKRELGSISRDLRFVASAK